MKLQRRVALLLLTALLVVPALVAFAGPDEGTFLSSLNSARQANGLAALTSHSTLVNYARSHSTEMAGTNSIYHSTSAELTGLVSGWQRIGENVGRGPSASAIHNALMNSPGHRANILGDYTHVGIGTATDPNGILYVTQVFMKLPGGTTTTTTTTSTTTTTTTSTTSTTTTTTTTTTTVPESTTTTKPSTTTTTKPGSTTTSTTTTTTVPSGSTTVPETTTTSSIVPMTAGEAVGCALAGLGLGAGDQVGEAQVTVSTCEEAGTAAADWPADTIIDGVVNDDGTVVLTFSVEAPETTTTSTTTSSTTTTTPESTTTTTSTTSTTEPVAPATTSPALNFSEPAAPGAANLIRLVAASVLGVVALFSIIVLVRRRR